MRTARKPATTRDEVAAVAAEHGWTLVNDKSYVQEFERLREPDLTTPLGRVLAKVSEDTGYVPKDEVTVWYREGTGALYGGRYYRYADVTVLHGQRTGAKSVHHGSHRKERVLSWLRER